jgi:hypothetical protein
MEHFSLKQSIGVDGYNRPSSIQKIVDTAFTSIVSRVRDSWTYNGAPAYNICGVSEYKVLMYIVEHSPYKKDFFVIDIGSGNFELIRGLGEYIEQEVAVPEGSRVHILGVRGEPYDGRSKIDYSKTSLHFLGKFKIENLTKEFLEKGFDIAGKVDLIVSRWCFRHLVDPVGTLIQAYHLLEPDHGYLATDGFLFLAGDQDHLGNDGNRRMVQLMLDMQVPFLTKDWSIDRSLNHFF